MGSLSVRQRLNLRVRTHNTQATVDLPGAPPPLPTAEPQEPAQRIDGDAVETHAADGVTMKEKCAWACGSCLKCTSVESLTSLVSAAHARPCLLLLQPAAARRPQRAGSSVASSAWRPSLPWSW